MEQTKIKEWNRICISVDPTNNNWPATFGIPGTEDEIEKWVEELLEKKIIPILKRGHLEHETYSQPEMFRDIIALAETPAQELFLFFTASCKVWELSQMLMQEHKKDLVDGLKGLFAMMLEGKGKNAFFGKL